MQVLMVQSQSWKPVPFLETGGNSCGSDVKYHQTQKTSFSSVRHQSGGRGHKKVLSPPVFLGHCGAAESDPGAQAEDSLMAACPLSLPASCLCLETFLSDFSKHSLLL